MNIKMSISNILIGIAACFTLLFSYDASFSQYGMNSFFLEQGKYHIYAMQFFTSQFLHSGAIHLVMNAIFIIIFGNAVEQVLGEKKYILFFIFSALFIGTGITIFGSEYTTTMGMSGFAMGVLAYYTFYLKSKNHPDYKGGFTALTINILIGLSPGISLLGHLFGAISGILFYMFTKKMK